MSAPRIRPMRPGDVLPAAELIRAGGWGDRRAMFEVLTSVPQGRPLVAELNGEVVGTGIGSAHGTVGWVGTIFVVEALRRRGLGRALTEAVVDALDAAGCVTQVLVSTAEGLPLYEALGFEHAADYRILEVGGLAKGSAASEDVAAERTASADDPRRPASGPRVRAFQPADLPSILELDATATGEDRGHLLRRFAIAESTKVLAHADGEIGGFVVRAPWGGGATIAPNPEDAIRILEARRLAAGPGGRVRVGVLSTNTTGLAALAAAGLAPVWSAPRLQRGAPLSWQPSWIWGQFNHAIG
jgi:predicted N-acetyltransferase YhbS